MGSMIRRLDNDELVWVDLDDPDAADFAAVSAEFGLHPLSVDDARKPHQRDKYVRFDEHGFLICHAIDLDLDEAELNPAEIDVFIGDRWIVTAHRGKTAMMEEIASRRTSSSEAGLGGVAFVVYGLLDHIVTTYFESIDEFERYCDEVADRVFGDTPIEPAHHREWFEIRRALNRFDRTSDPLATALHDLVDQDLDRFESAATPYLRDVAGEAARASSEIASLRRLVDHIDDANMALRDHRQNVVMKKVTSWAAIIAAPTLVTGYYGMNVPVPGTDQTSGVVTASAIALGCSVALYVSFKRLGWL